MYVMGVQMCIWWVYICECGVCTNMYVRGVQMCMWWVYRHVCGGCTDVYVHIPVCHIHR